MAAKTGEEKDNTMNILNQQLDNISADNKYVTFRVLDEEYGVDVLKVQEILRYRQPTKIPNTPEVIKGVLNFRGDVIPILDLRRKFGLPLKEYDNFTVIITLEVKDKIIGIIVDNVSDIISFANEDIQDTLDFSSDVDTEFIRGMAKSEGRLIMLLELSQLLSFKEFKVVSKLNNKEEEKLEEQE